MLNRIEIAAFDIPLKVGKASSILEGDVCPPFEGSRNNINGVNGQTFTSVLQSGIDNLRTRAGNNQRTTERFTVDEKRDDETLRREEVEEPEIGQKNEDSAKSLQKDDLPGVIDREKSVPDSERSESVSGESAGILGRSSIISNPSAPEFYDGAKLTVTGDTGESLLETAVNKGGESPAVESHRAILQEELYKYSEKAVIDENSGYSDQGREKGMGLSRFSAEGDVPAHGFSRGDAHDPACDLSSVVKGKSITTTTHDASKIDIKAGVADLPVNRAEELSPPKIQTEAVTAGQHNDTVHVMDSSKGPGAADPAAVEAFLPDLAIKKAEKPLSVDSQRGVDTAFYRSAEKAVIEENPSYYDQGSGNRQDLPTFSREVDASARDISSELKNGFIAFPETENSRGSLDRLTVLKSKEAKEMLLNPPRFNSETDQTFRISGPDGVNSYNNLSFSLGAADFLSTEDMIRAGQLISQLPDSAFKVPGRIRISLYPESLGNVDIDITVNGSKVRVVLTADRTDVVQALQGQQEQLRNTFESHNLQLNSLDFQIRENSTAMDDGARGGPLWQHENQGRSQNGDNRGENMTGMGQLTPAMKDPLRLKTQRNEGVISLFI